MDCRAETHFRQKETRGPYGGVPERAGYVQQQVIFMLSPPIGVVFIN